MYINKDGYLVLNPAGLLWRWYLLYGRLGGRTRDPENTCRFIRVVFLWAPLRWLFAERLDGRQRIAPFFVGLMAAVLTTILGLFSYLVYTNFWDAMILFAIIIGVFLTIGLVLFLSKKGKELYNESVATMDSYRKAKAGRMCPLIRLERSGIPDVDGHIVPPGGPAASLYDDDDYDEEAELEIAEAGRQTRDEG